MVLAHSDTIQLDELPSSILGRRPGPSPTAVAAAGDVSLKRVTETAEEVAIRAALERAGGNRRVAAEALGISVRALFYKLKQLAID